MPVTIETTYQGDPLVLKVVGDSLETENVASFRTAIAPILERSKRIVLDMSTITFMDSTGLGSMLSCLRTVKAKDGSIKLADLTPEVRQLFEMVLMDRVFEIYPTVDDARQSFARR